EHWRGVAMAASEQCGRTRLPTLAPVRGFAEHIGELARASQTEQRFVLSLREARPFAEALKPALHCDCSLLFVSGPEGGLSEAEETLARAAG
ncbi:16S rRNA (uracil(1498)-N(3))-methyltransferase, partial [Acinetobacter baumannii]